MNQMKTYCVKEKKLTDCVPGSETLTKTSKGRPMMKCKCSSCGIIKTRFLSDADYRNLKMTKK